MPSSWSCVWYAHMGGGLCEEQTMTYEQFKAKWTRKLGSFVLVAILNDLVKVGILRSV